MAKFCCAQEIRYWVVPIWIVRHETFHGNHIACRQIKNVCAEKGRECVAVASAVGAKVTKRRDEFNFSYKLELLATARVFDQGRLDP